jgi:hypothetical protein
MFHDETPSVSSLLNLNGRILVDRDTTVKQNLIFYRTRKR